MKVLPFNYHEESSVGNEGKECIARREIKIEPRESSVMAKKCTVESFGNNETSMELGVSAENKVNAICSVDADRRYNPYNESCSVLLTTKHTTKNKKYDYDTSCGVNLVKDTDSPETSVKKDHEDEAKQDREDYRFKKSCWVLNAIKDPPSSCTGSTEEVQKGKTFDKTCKVLNIIEKKQDQRQTTFNESCSVINTIRNASPITGFVKESERGRMLLDCKNSHSSLLFTKPTRDGAYREPCSVKNVMDGPPFSERKSCRIKRKKKKRTRKFVLRKSESQSSLSTKEISGDDTEWMRSPANYSNDGDTHVLKVRFINDEDMKICLPNTGSEERVVDISIEGSDLANKIMVHSDLGRKKDEKKEQFQPNGVKHFSPTKKPSGQTGNLPDKVNIPKANPSEVSSSLDTQTADSDQYEDIKKKVLKKLSKNPLLVQTSNFQGVSSRSKTFEMDGHYGVMKSSSLESFFDALSDDESIVVSSSTKSREVRTTTEEIWKRFRPVKTSKLSLEGKNNCASGKLTPDKSTKSVVTSSKKREELSENSKNNGERIKALKTSNSESLLQNKSSSTSLEMTAVTSRKKEDILSAKSCKNTKRNTAAKSSNITSSSKNQEKNITRTSLNHEMTTHANDSRMVTSSTDQKTNNKDSVASVINQKKARTPNSRNVQKSVFETPSPCSVVTLTRELLPGGLCEVENVIFRAEMERGSSLAPLVDTARTFSNKKQNTERIEKPQIPSKSPREHGEKTSVENNGRIFKGSETLEIESKDSNMFSTGAGERISHKEMGTSYDVDILTQEIAKQPRKRKLECNNPDSTGKTKSWLVDKQAVRSQKISTLQDDCERKSKSKYCKYSGRESLVDRKESSKKTGENVKGSYKNLTKSEENVKLGKDHTKKCKVDQTKQSEARSPCDGTSLLVCKSNSSRKKNSEAGNGNSKQVISKKTDSGSEMVFDDIFRSKEHATVLDHSQSSDEDYVSFFTLFYLVPKWSKTRVVW